MFQFVLDIRITNTTQSDGTSDTSAARYDATCGRSSAFKPAPEAGTWFNAYFEMLLKNANPPLA